MASIEQLSKMEDQEQIPQVDSSTPSHQSDSSDSSYDFAQDLNQKPSFKRSPEEEKELLYKYRGKHGLKYAKISNEQRQKLIKQVTTTGCTIKSAAKELNINFSTAKAIMQIYRKEGRTSKKIKRDNKKTLTTKQEILNQTTSGKPNYGEQRQTKVDVVQDNLETNLYQQAEETNRNQALLIQQLNTQVNKLKLMNFRICYYPAEYSNYNRKNNNQLKTSPIQLINITNYNRWYQNLKYHSQMSQMVPSYYRPYP